MKLLQGLFLLLIFYSCKDEKNTVFNEHKGLISRIDSLISNRNFNGVIAIAKDSTILYSKVQGYSDIEQEKELKLDDQFVIGSISKQITAVLILREYETGLLKLDDKIGQYLKDVKQPWTDEITIHHLLTHTHGIEAIDQALAFEPGTQFRYSQLGYELLAQILQSINNRPFEEIANELFEEYGLNKTCHPANSDHYELTKGYTENENGNLVDASNSLLNYPAAGSMISTAKDIIQWNYLLHSEQLLMKETLALMKKRYATRIHPIFDTVEYGYGLLFKKGESDMEIGALGYAPGFVSASYYYPKTKMNLVVLQNTARNLNDFRETFKVQIRLMEEVKNKISTELL